MYFDARGTVLGDATAGQDGLVIRTVVPELAARPLVTLVELRGPPQFQEGVVRGLKARYDVEVRKTDSDEGEWRGRVTYNDPDQLHVNPVYKALLTRDDRVAAGLLYFEGGLAILRFDMRDPDDDIEDLVSEMKAELQEVAAGQVFMRPVRHAEPLEDWYPVIAVVLRDLLETVNEG